MIPSYRRLHFVVFKVLCLFLWIAIRPTNAAELLPRETSIASAIDHYIEAQLSEAGVSAAPQASDESLVRRLTLDLSGRIPTRTEYAEYLASSDPKKREQLIERLMASPWYDHHLATMLNSILRGPGHDGPDLREYLLEAVQSRRPWNQMFQEMMGTVAAPPGAEKFVRDRLTDQDLLTRDMSSIFFGINVSCAQCHIHPYVSTLTQDHYFGLKAFFARSIVFEDKLLERSFGKPKIEYTTNEGENRAVGMMFLNGTTVEPQLPVADDVSKAIEEENKRIEELTKANQERKKNKSTDPLEFPTKPDYSFRAQLVEVAFREENQPQFAKALVNRLWHQLFGYGLVMRVDQMHDANPSSHPELLDWLARDLMESGYNYHRLIQGMVSSQTYSRSSQLPHGDTPRRELFAVATLRPLTPMQFGVSVLVCGDPTWSTEISRSDLSAKISEIESRAGQLFSDVIEMPCDDLQINAAEALTMSNDISRLQVVGEKLVAEILKTSDRKQQIDSAVEHVLSRSATVQEAIQLTEFVVRTELGLNPDAPDPSSAAQGAWRQAIWALTTSSEFRFNH
ncbi:MAG: DUF1549 domain-containing protein [Planctomycetota bacterium]|nr:DUF1549 domain-containing protein [Planctomycetota bacterium]MDA1178870.1 DUF1549 domain-containing protein [Planctomycetota bacterium]